MKTLIERWKAKTPAFWKKVQRVCFAIAGTSAAGFTVLDQLPAGAEHFLEIGTAIGLFGVFLAQLTKE